MNFTITRAVVDIFLCFYYLYEQYYVIFWYGELMMWGEGGYRMTNTEQYQVCGKEINHLFFCIEIDTLVIRHNYIYNI